MCVDLAVEIVAVGHEEERELPRDRAAHLFGEERHGIGLPAALGVPENAQFAEIGMGGFNQFQHLRAGLIGCLRRRRRAVRLGEFLDGDLDHAPSQAFFGRELALQLLLTQDRLHRVVDAEHLMIARDDFAGSAGLAVIEEDEILDQIEQTPVVQHAIEQHLGIEAALIALIETLPFGEVLPLAGDGAVARMVAVADDQECVVVEGVGNDVLIEIVAQVAVIAGADVLVDGLEFDEDEGQSVDEADQVRAPVVSGRAEAGDLEFTDGQEAVIGDAVDGKVLEVDNAGAFGVKLAVRVAVTDGNAIADQAIEVAIVLEQGGEKSC